MLTSGVANARLDEVVVSVITAHLGAAHFQEVVDEVTEVLRAESMDVPGFITGHVLVNTDARKLAIVTEWRNSHFWSASRYDKRVGQMLEDCLVNSSVLDFELYSGKAHFVATAAGGL